MKIIKAFFIFGFILLGAMPSVLAEFKSVQTGPFHAIAGAAGTKEVSFTCVIKTITDINGVDRLKFDWPVGIDPVTVDWVISDQVLVITSTVTDFAGGIQIYTNNYNAAGTIDDPVFFDPTEEITIDPNSDPAGLLHVNKRDTQTNRTLGLAWSIKLTLLIPGVDFFAADPLNGPESGTGNRFQWLSMLDLDTPAIDRNGDGDAEDFNPGDVGEGQSLDTRGFTNADPFVTVINSDGLHVRQSPSEFEGDTNRISYLYLQTFLGQAIPQATYQTTQIVVESFTQ